MPAWNEKEIDAYFAHFEIVAKTLKWSEDSWAPMLLSALKGKTQIACTNLSLEDAQVYDKLKTAIYLHTRWCPNITNIISVMCVRLTMRRLGILCVNRSACLSVGLYVK